MLDRILDAALRWFDDSGIPMDPAPGPEPYPWPQGIGKVVLSWPGWR